MKHFDLREFSSFSLSVCGHCGAVLTTQFSCTKLISLASLCCERKVCRLGVLFCAYATSVTQIMFLEGMHEFACSIFMIDVLS